MTPKEKALDIYHKMHYQNQIVSIEAKQCALIAVDEILGDIDDSILHPQNKEAIDYWQEVKQEIEKL
jgi:hypothetical protein